MDIFIRENSFIAKIAALVLQESTMAVTINTTIYLHNCTKENFLKNTRWVTHEIVHILQYKRIGTAQFIFLYVKESLLTGYKNNKFEVEARMRETDTRLLQNMHFI